MLTQSCGNRVLPKAVAIEFFPTQHFTADYKLLLGASIRRTSSPSY
jgi:hypothetical protein